MYTKCPECHAIFRVTAEQFEIADGLVRCGLCDSVFNGKDHLHEDYEESISETSDAVEHEQELLYGDDTADFSTQDHDQQVDDEALIAAEEIPGVIRDDFSGSLRFKNNSIQIAVWTAGAIALAIFFLGQITYWQDVEVLPRSWVDKFCQIAACGSEDKRDLAAIKVLNRNIYTHPNVKNALMITASFVNESEISQPFPLLQIALLDTQGKIVAIRRFPPKDYLVNKNLATALMQPDQPVGARLEVFDPGSAVIAYEIEFY